jgi:N-acetylglutamate synthase-like GNAT family acetyltransferase
MREITFRLAQPSDVPGITACVCEAYVQYIERIGKQPAPMLENYAEVIEHNEVHVAVSADVVVGVIVLTKTEEGFCLDNVAVRPAVQGQGVGRTLLQLAEVEASRQGFQSIYLFTNELMTENRALYSKIGYVEYDRRVVNGYPRVFFRKALA